MSLVRVAVLTAAASVSCAAIGFAQSESPVDRPCVTKISPSFPRLFTGMFGDLRRLPSRRNFAWMAGGGGAAAGAHAIDDRVADHPSGSHHALAKPGAILGGATFELGASLSSYIIGRASNNPCTALVAADAVQAQLVAEALTVAVKFSARRKRPEGSGFAFPSGHASVTFASATVLQRHFGWKAGVPAYAVATYVAASRVQMRRHFLSDVIFGAALGIVAGRTAMSGRDKHALVLSPLLIPGGIGAWVNIVQK